MNKQSDNSIYYNGSKLLSFNKNINFLLSSRGVGKSTYFKSLFVRKAIQSIEKHRDSKGNINISKIDQFIILRRFKKEIATTHIASSMDDIKHMYPKYDLFVRSRSVMLCDKGTDRKNAVEIGRFYALTEQLYIRSSVHNRVTNILLDEAFLDPKTHFKYLNNEPTILLEILSSIIRNRKNVRTIIAGNLIQMSSIPYFQTFKFDINPADPFQKEFYMCNNNDQVMLQIYQSKERFKENLLESPFAKLCSQVEGYGDYLINGSSLVKVNDAFIMSKKDKPKDLKFECSFCVDDENIGLWYSDKEAIYYFCKLTDPSSKFKYAINDSDRNIDIKGIKQFKASYICKMLRMLNSQNSVFFEDHFVQEKANKIIASI